MKAAVFLLLLAVSPLWARVLPVPSARYPTVQAGLDRAAANDTVLVEPGTYSEALTAPALPFVLKGDVVPDTGDYPRPVIDPTPLPGSDTLKCMVVPAGSAPVVEDFYFRNGPAMWTHWHSAGVLIYCPHACFRRCIFDSTNEGLYLLATCSLRVEQCRFLNVWESVRSPLAPSWIEAIDCFFSGDGWAHVSCSGGAVLQRCRFGTAAQGPACWLDGPAQITIENCQFGPLSPGGPDQSYPILLLNWTSGTIVNNLFSGYRVAQGLIAVGCRCDGSDSLTIRHNRFSNDTLDAEGYLSICVSRQSQLTEDCRVTIDSNVFEDNTALFPLYCRGVTFDRYTGGTVAGNRFHDLSSDSVSPWHPLMPVIWPTECGTVALHGNRFGSTGLALLDEHAAPGLLDAAMNWWGDRSGPYEAGTNPQGRGDTIIGNNVDFSRWCLDTTCTTFDAVPPSRNLHPTSVSLSAFPNPFNSTTMLHLQVPEPEIIRVELYDVLGRRVNELWSGVVADEKEIAFDGSSLASGVYFVRVTNTIWNRPLISTKLVLLK